ncbi:RNA binding protein [Oryctes borbonicus]|uniref:RNA binding protein n=1 Tax=Oryctes borbonicus TaxID=1629725 RepID=A0A0T6ASZ3_9SCAR|nr:RNA binding protein [Oryctes borbonicus]
MEGFKAIACVFSEESSAQHQLFIKEHSVRNQSPEKPAGRTLFVINVPPYATQKNLKRAFSVVGPVKYVNLHDDIKHTQEQSKRSGYKVAYIVYEKSSDLKKALTLDIIGPFSTSKHTIVLGLRKWIQEYNNGIVNRNKLSEYCTQTINKYDNDRSKAEKDKQVTTMTKDGLWLQIKAGIRVFLSGFETFLMRSYYHYNALNGSVNVKQSVLNRFYSSLDAQAVI